MVSGHFLSRDTWRTESGYPKYAKKKHRDLHEAYFDFSNDLNTEQKYVCHNCHYEDFVTDETAFYYLVFGNFVGNEPPGFECPNCGGPMISR